MGLFIHLMIMYKVGTCHIPACEDRVIEVALFLSSSGSQPTGEAEETTHAPWNLPASYRVHVCGGAGARNLNVIV